MRKWILAAAATVGVCVHAIAQDAYEGTIDYDKKKQQAFVIDFSYPPEAVENAVLDKMSKLGYKGKQEKGFLNKDKGFYVFKGAYISDISTSSLDYIVKVEPRSKRDKDNSTLYLVISKDGSNARSSFSPDEVYRSKSFLQALAPDVEAANLELQITAQGDVIARAEKKLKDLQDDKTDMENKIKKLQDDIKKNEKDQADTQKDIENQKVNLEALKGKRRSGN